MLVRADDDHLAGTLLACVPPDLVKKLTTDAVPVFGIGHAEVIDGASQTRRVDRRARCKDANDETIDRAVCDSNEGQDVSAPQQQRDIGKVLGS